MSAGWIVLIVLAALVGILWIPLRARAVYEGDLTAELRVLFFRFRLYPRPPKKPKKKAKPKEEPKSKEETTPQNEEQKTAPSPKTLLDYAKLAAELLGDLRRKLVLRELTVRAVFGGKDPADAALNYGRAWAAIGAVTPPLERAFRIRKRNLSAEYDETKKTIELYAAAEISLTAAAIIGLAWKALRGYLAIRRKTKTEKKAVQQHEQSHS